MKPTLFVVSLAAASFFAISPRSIAHGISANHISAVDTQDGERQHWRYRYSGIYFGLPYDAYGVDYYDADYCYTPTPEQLAAAREQVKDYLVAVKKHRKHASTHRYISVETLRPTKKQLEDYREKGSEGRFATGPQGTAPSTHSNDSSKLRCLMVYDTQTKQFVGSGCYLVASEPPVGNVSIFQTVSAEFVGQNSL
jgi:hypothetical protein